MGWKEDGEPWYDEDNEECGAAIKAVKALPRRISKGYKALREAKTLVSNIEYQLRNAKFELSELETNNSRYLREAIGEALNVPLSSLVVSGGWECLHSPTGFCIYDTRQSVHDDICVLCGHPDERQ